jgi:hypothetical protein
MIVIVPRYIITTDEIGITVHLIFDCVSAGVIKMIVVPIRYNGSPKIAQYGFKQMIEAKNTKVLDNIVLDDFLVCSVIKLPVTVCVQPPACPKKPPEC